MKVHTIAAITILTVPFFALPATGEDTAGLEQGRAQGRDDMRFRNMDANNDGRITRAEWRGSDREFSTLDWNNDGMLSGDELRVETSRPGRQNQGADDDFYEWTDAGFRDLDRNRDGRIARGEWPYAAQMFARADRNRDNRLSRSEFLGYDTEQDEAGGDGRFDELDRNNNSRLERREWQGTRDAFDRLDRNGDGWLSRAETADDEVDDARGSFSSYDADRNGTIEADEWPGTRRSFDLRDRNRDGRLTRSEAGELNANTNTNANAGTGWQQAPSSRDQVLVSARERWTDTGIDVRAGDRVQVQAQGTITLSSNDNGQDTAGPAGAFNGRRADNAPLANAPAGALIGRIGDGQPFLLGAGQSTPQLRQSGRLYLGVNDDHLGDNRGEFTVRVSINR